MTLAQVAALPLHHRLAASAALVLADLDGEPLVLRAGAGPQEINGSPVRDVGQLMQLVALGQAIAVVPESARRHVRPDVVLVPVLDAPTDSILLAWPPGSRSAAVAAFVLASTQTTASDRVQTRVDKAVRLTSDR